MSKRRERKRAVDEHEAAHIASRKHLDRAVWFAKRTGAARLVGRAKEVAL